MKKEKTSAIMQPYLFPYIGYFNLVQESDVFVFYDDVNYIKKGRINKNNILINKQEYSFTVPIKKISQNRLIYETEISEKKIFLDNFVNQLSRSYKKAQFFNETINYIYKTFDTDSNSISKIAIESIKNFFEYIEIDKKFLISSKNFQQTKHLDKSDRLIEISKLLACKRYINTIGGLELYTKEYFSSKSIDLNFVKPNVLSYKQINSNNFIPKLSIIDLMMNLPKKELVHHLNSYEIE